MFGEFERVREQILQDLLQTFRVGHKTAAEPWVCEYIESNLPVFRFVTERASDHVEHAGEEDFFGLDRNGSGFNFRKIENIRNQIQQVRAGAVNGSRESTCC